MKLPNKIRIKTKVAYEIVFQDVIKSDLNCLGFCDGNKHIIYLKNGLSKKELKKTFLHEVFHAWCFEYNINIPHESIYLLEDAVLNTLSLNKWI